ncbi:DUF222 domain-containing protein [Microbacterium aurum]|uniref:HNH endonuclease signature motif containing protein n=1 Tax=Microbacterium aurum TaxID=36805 RepID=UPI0028E33EA4|nr:DUF222 domain-containing protein [Microbacterium aurum]
MPIPFPEQPEPPRRPVEFDAPDAGMPDHALGRSSVAPLIDPHWAELSRLLGRAETNRAEMSRLQAERAELCAEALDLVAMRVAQRQAARPNREIGDTIPLREVMAELAAALRVGERTVSTWLGDGSALVTTYPTTLDALREGRIDERHASAIIDGGRALDPEHREEYERLVLEVAERDTAPATRHFARVVVARLQPETVDESHRRALAERRVRMFDLDDGLSRLLLDGATAVIHGIFDRLTSMGIAQGDLDEPRADEDAEADESDESVEADKSDEPDEPDEPDERTLDQRRADIMCDLLLTGCPALDGDAGLSAIRATVQVTIPLLTLASLDDEPALLDGEAPIDAETARALAATAPCWQRIMIHPVTHEPLRLDTYRPSKRLRRLIGARDQRCRWPGCRRTARRSDIDHTIPFEDGGPTCAGNLEVLCRRHHTLKHASPWQVVQRGGGSIEFISPTGRRYRTDSPPVLAGAAGRPAWARYFDAPMDPADHPAF